MKRAVIVHGRRAGMPETLATRVIQFLTRYPTGSAFTVSGEPYEDDTVWQYIDLLLPPNSPLALDGLSRLVDESGTRAVSLEPRDVVGPEGLHGPVLFIMNDTGNFHPDDFVTVLSAAKNLTSHVDSEIVVAGRPDTTGGSYDLFVELTYDPEWEVTEWRLDPPEPARYIPEPEPDPVEPDPDPDPEPTPAETETEPEESPDDDLA